MYKLRDFSMRREQRIGPSLRQQVATKSHYIVDLPRLLGECEANFLRLKKLTGAMTREEVVFSLDQGGEELKHRLVLLERARFTSTWLLDLASPTLSPWLKLPQITLRAYHDATMVEVIAWEGHRRLKPRYPIPNPLAFARDEKFQANRFLGEWLQACLDRGRSAEFVEVPSA